MVSYFKIVKIDKFLKLEDIGGNLNDVPPIFKKQVYEARKRNMAIRLPNDLTKKNFVKYIELDEFDRYRLENI